MASTRRHLSVKLGGNNGTGEKRLFIALAVLSIAVVALSTLFFATITRSTLDRSMRIGSSGTVKAIGVGVYWDSSYTNKVSSISWGIIEPGSLNNVSVYIKNESNSPITLTLQTENWNPTNASNYLALSWDYDGQTINVDEVIQVTLTLTVSSSIQGITNFNFDIVISGSG